MLVGARKLRRVPQSRWVRLANIMATSQFEIEIIEQGWLGSEQTEYDLFSHGKISLVIGGQVILSGDEEYGNSESALKPNGVRA